MSVAASAPQFLVYAWTGKNDITFCRAGLPHFFFCSTDRFDARQFYHGAAAGLRVLGEVMHMIST